MDGDGHRQRPVRRGSRKGRTPGVIPIRIPLALTCGVTSKSPLSASCFRPLLAGMHSVLLRTAVVLGYEPGRCSIDSVLLLPSWSHFFFPFVTARKCLALGGDVVALAGRARSHKEPNMSGYEAGSTSFSRPDSHNTEPVSAETIERCAQLLACGEIDWPQGLSNDQEAELLAAVRRCRRARLVKFIASRIAADIAQESRSKAKETQR